MSIGAMETRKFTRPFRMTTKSCSTKLTSLASAENSSDSENYNIGCNKQHVKKKLTHSARNNMLCCSESDSSDDSDNIILSRIIKDRPTKAAVSPQKTPRKDKLRPTTIDVENVTPPKQPKCDTSPSNASSPSSLFRELDLNSLPLTSDTRKNIYQTARKALYSSVPKTMPGRENELRELTDFITKHLEDGTSGSLYVSGPPGTGKTATLNMILQSDAVSRKLKTVYINCTGIKSPGAIYSKIIQELDLKIPGRTEKECISTITKFLTRSRSTILLVLDEIDQLTQSTAHQRTLYTLFSLPSSFPLLLIGIANALDLTDRLLPRLQSRCSTDVKPKLLHFPPYTRPQIVTIFTERLREALGEGEEVFDKAALAMLAGKVAAMSGDVRKALDIGRRVVEMVEGRQNCDNVTTSTSVLKSIENDVKSHPKPTPKTVKLQQVVNVLNTIYGTSNSLSSEDSHSTFPLQQKIIICSLLLHLKHGKSKDITVGKLHEIYNRICTKRNIVSVDQAEFYGLLGLVETRGIIRVSGKKDRRMHKVNLEWDEGEVELALRDKEMISSILQDDSCLKRM